MNYAPQMTTAAYQSLARPAGKMNRVFLVGCSRSGTSVVQTLLACHPEVQSFPESDYFTKLHRHTRRSHLIKLGLATRRERPHLAGWLRAIGEGAKADALPRQPIRFAPAVRSFIGSLDRITIESGRAIWIEKTPLHLLHLDLIERYVPDATVLHLVRGGRDVVASLYDRAHKHAHQFGGQRNIDVCVDLWNRCMDETLATVGKKGHHIVMYERAVSEPLAFVNRVGAVLGLTYTQDDIDRRGSRANDYVRGYEKWKGGISKPVRPQRSKFGVVFDDEQQRHIEGRLHLNAYDAAEAAALF